jgi:ring-1,2-phenylacetyl-CoA epoxidase subunit PaaD
MQIIKKEDILSALEEVKDPEIPTISLVDLGIVTQVNIDESNNVHVVLTPTFSGCPALKIMEQLVSDRLVVFPNINKVTVETNFDVAWNTNRITEKGLIALKKHGLAPPPRHEGFIELEVLSDTPCPYCDSYNTTLESPFGPTLCRSLHYCKNCSQAFEGFKPLT